MVQPIQMAPAKDAFYLRTWQWQWQKDQEKKKGGNIAKETPPILL
jgi:hypothetical protein